MILTESKTPWFTKEQQVSELPKVEPTYFKFKYLLLLIFLVFLFFDV